MTMFRWNALDNGALAFGMYSYGPWAASIDIAKDTLTMSDTDKYPIAIVRLEEENMCIVEVLQCKPSLIQPLSV